VKKNTEPITFAVADFLAGLRLTGSERVLGALSLALAESMDAAPPYAKGRIAHELRQIPRRTLEGRARPGQPGLAPGHRAVKKSKATVDEHLDAAFASLDDLTIRQLEATSEAMGSRRHPLFDFSSIFREAAHAREGGWTTDLAAITCGSECPAPTSIPVLSAATEGKP
jgi:hypothetical protein